MTAGRRTLALAAVAMAWALASGAATADRYRVLTSFLPPQLVDDGRSYVKMLELSGGVTFIENANTAPPSTPPPAPPVTITLPATMDPGMAGCAAYRAENPPGTQASMRHWLVPSPMPIDPAFINRISLYYGFNVPAEQLGAWIFFARGGTLPFEDRVRDAAVWWMLLTGRPPSSSSSTARPDLLKPSATRATPRVTVAMALVAAPWGKGTGNFLNAGQNVTLVPPAQGAWYRVKVNGRREWACGIWLDLQ